MLNATKLTLLVILMTSACLAQNEGAKAADQTKYFRLEFVIKELDGGKVVNARHYAATTATGDSPFGTSSIRTGSKVPAPQGNNGAFTYLDVGVSIDCRSAREVDGSLALNVAADVSSAATTSNPPVIRQNKWSANVIVPIGKPTVVFSSDDVTTKGQLQLELTATPIK